MSGGYNVLDTREFDKFIAQTDSFQQRFTNIRNSYNDIVSTLLDNWSGRGADAFRADATIVAKNIGGVYDILKIMCDTLTDCRQVFGECDTALGDYNRNPSAG
ncbi:MAG: hypothetical protein IKQ90_09615 [Ruminococcus sp.]|nr:hypothetical protein [Ruminococcus sp.]